MNVKNVVKIKFFSFEPLETKDSSPKHSSSQLQTQTLRSQSSSPDKNCSKPKISTLFPNKFSSFITKEKNKTNKTTYFEDINSAKDDQIIYSVGVNNAKDSKNFFRDTQRNRCRFENSTNSINNYALRGNTIKNNGTNDSFFYDFSKLLPNDLDKVDSLDNELKKPLINNKRSFDIITKNNIDIDNNDMYLETMKNEILYYESEKNWQMVALKNNELGSYYRDLGDNFQAGSAYYQAAQNYLLLKIPSQVNSELSYALEVLQHIPSEDQKMNLQILLGQLHNLKVEILTELAEKAYNDGYFEKAIDDYLEATNYLFLLGQKSKGRQIFRIIADMHIARGNHAHAIKYYVCAKNFAKAGLLAYNIKDYQRALYCFYAGSYKAESDNGANSEGFFRSYDDLIADCIFKMDKLKIDYKKFSATAMKNAREIYQWAERNDLLREIDERC